MVSSLSAGVRVPSMHPYRCIRVPDGVKMASDLSAIMYEPVIWYRCIRVPDGVKMVSSLSATIYEPDVSPMEPAAIREV